MTATPVLVVICAALKPIRQVHTRQAKREGSDGEWFQSFISEGKKCVGLT